jgi:hypothetical protein
MFGASRFMGGANFCFSVETEYSEDGACCLFDPRYDLFVFCQPGLWPMPLELFDIRICQKDNDACIRNEYLFIVPVCYVLTTRCLGRRLCLLG